jgi:hypothetical protein
MKVKSGKKIIQHRNISGKIHILNLHNILNNHVKKKLRRQITYVLCQTLAFLIIKSTY